MITLQCKSCGCDVERNYVIDDASCFSCKRKRQNEYTRNYFIKNPHFKNRIRKITAKKKADVDFFAKYRPNKKA